MSEQAWRKWWRPWRTATEEPPAEAPRTEASPAEAPPVEASRPEACPAETPPLEASRPDAEASSLEASAETARESWYRRLRAGVNPEKYLKSWIKCAWS